jgi:predicted TIM-barrel fold metal-dependent hydrolase
MRSDNDRSEPVTELKVIDFHQHGRPDSFWDALAARGRTIHGGRPFPPRTRPAETVEMMDRVGMSAAFLSAPDAESLFTDLEFGRVQARDINEFFAGMVRTYPGRFGAFACLPMPHVDASLKELEYALDTLKFDGVQLMTSYEGRYSGSAEFDPILQECNRRGAFVFVHPATPPGMDLLKLDIPCFVLEFVNDTSRCITNFLVNDIATRYPRIRFLFSHAGGAAPYLAARLALIDLFGNPRNELSIAQAREKTRQGLSSFYYDTALSAVDPVLRMMADLVGVERILFGSDWPQAKEPFVQDTVDGVRFSKALNAAERYAVARGNGLSLFPGFALPGDAQAARASA